MKIIKPSHEVWEQEEGLEGIYKQIERCGRVCYASDPIEGKAKDFVDRMISNGHGAMLEHGTVYLYLTAQTAVTGYKYRDNSYSRYIEIREKEEPYPIVHKYITTNYRVLVENNWLDDLQYLCEPTEYHEKRITVHFTTQIAVTREFNRHRVDSIAEQSTRYCNFGKEKFGGVGINLPSFVDFNIGEDKDPVDKDFVDACEIIADGEYESWKAIQYWLFANQACEFSYLNLLRLGWKPEQARTILPLDTNSQLSHTAFVSDWEHFFKLRDDSHAHPDARVLAAPLHEEFIKRGLCQK